MQDTNFIPFLNTMNRAISDMAGVEVSNGPLKETSKEDKYDADISVGIEISGGQNFTILLSASNQAAISLTGMITGMSDIQPGSSILADVLGEILNMTVGTAQREVDYHYDFSTPRIIKEGENPDYFSMDKICRQVVSLVQGEKISLCLIESAA